MSQRHTSPPDRERGFTLIELILVLGLLVAVTVLAWPRVDRMLLRAEHRAAAEQLQSTLWRLRLEAIQTGCPQWFRYCPETSDYQVAALPYDEVEQVDFTRLPVGDADWDEDALDPDAGTDSFSTERLGPDGEVTERMRLENGMIFVDPGRPWGLALDGSESLGTETEELAELEALLPEEDPPFDASISDTTTECPWSEPIVFYPDGQADQARIVLKAPSGHIIEVTVSGMASHVRIGPRQPPRDRIQEPDTLRDPDDLPVPDNLPVEP